MMHRIVVGALTVVALCVATNVAAQGKAKIERGMKGYDACASLPEEDIAALVAYIETLKKK
jgi:hypothetical protein